MKLEAPVVTYRIWHVPFEGLKDPSKLALVSMSNAKHWRVGVNRARCFPPAWAVTIDGCYDHGHKNAPGEKCMCGLHGATRLDETKRWKHTGIVPFAIGAILQWGAMFSGGKVVRSSHAEVVGLANNIDCAVDLSRMYKVALTPLGHLESAAKEFGDELTDEQIEELRCHDQT